MRQFLLLLSFVTVLLSCKKNKTEEEYIPNNKAVEWAKTYGGSNYDFAKSILQLPNGDYIMAGTSRSSDGDIPGSRFGYDPWIMRLDTSGKKIWSVCYGTGADEHTNTIAATSDGGYLLAGFTGWLFDTVGNQAILIKTNSTGAQEWRKDYTTTADSKAMDLASATDGTIIAGYTSAPGKGREGWVFKMDNSGNTLWSKTYGGIGDDQITSITKSSDGGYVVAGYTTSSELGPIKGAVDGWLTKIDGSGNVIWTKLYGGTKNDYFKSVTSTSDGGYVSVGSSNSADGDFPLNRGRYDECVIKVDGNGNKVWSKTFGGTNEEFVTSVVEGKSQELIAIAYTNSHNYDVNRLGGDVGGWVIKLDKDGNKTASSTYGEMYDELMDKVTTTQDGGYIVAGQMYNPSFQYDAWIVKIKGL